MSGKHQRHSKCSKVTTFCDASNLDMYRGITLSCCLSKLSESVLSRVFEQWLTTDDLQYGFNKHSSCCHALITLKESVKCFVQKGSRVLCVSFSMSLRLSAMFIVGFKFFRQFFLQFLVIFRRKNVYKVKFVIFWVA